MVCCGLVLRSKARNCFSVRKPPEGMDEPDIFEQALLDEA